MKAVRSNASLNGWGMDGDGLLEVWQWQWAMGNEGLAAVGVGDVASWVKLRCQKFTKAG
jgi:hypothetical protein